MKHSHLENEHCREIEDHVRVSIPRTETDGIHDHNVCEHSERLSKNDQVTSERYAAIKSNEIDMNATVNLPKFSLHRTFQIRFEKNTEIADQIAKKSEHVISRGDEIKVSVISLDEIQMINLIAKKTHEHNVNGYNQIKQFVRCP